MVGCRALESLAGCYLASPVVARRWEKLARKLFLFQQTRHGETGGRWLFFAQQPNPPPVSSTRHYLWNYQQARGVKFHERRNSSQSVNNSDFDLRQALLINVSLVPTLFWWLWYKFRLNILHMLFLNVSLHHTHIIQIWSSVSYTHLTLPTKA